MGSVVDPNDIEVNDPEVVKTEREPIQMNAMNDSPVYHPGKKYTWDPDAQFVLSGKEFGLWLTTIRGIVTTKEAVQLRMALECNNVIENIMTRGVTSGEIREVLEPNA